MERTGHLLLILFAIFAIFYGNYGFLSAVIAYYVSYQVLYYWYLLPNAEKKLRGERRSTGKDYTREDIDNEANQSVVTLVIVAMVIFAVVWTVASGLGVFGSRSTFAPDLGPSDGLYPNR